VGEAAQLGFDVVEMASDLIEAPPKARRQPGYGFLKGQMHGGQQLARLIMELMGDAVALGLLGLQELTGETL
jgi:hypothetical protein